MTTQTDQQGHLAVRVCAACHQPAARVERITRHRLNLIIPLGTTFRHRCAACSRTFTISSTYRMIVGVVASAAMLGCAAVVLTADRSGSSVTGPWPQLVGAAVILLGLGFLLLMTVRPWLNRARNPVAPGAV